MMRFIVAKKAPSKSFLFRMQNKKKKEKNTSDRKSGKMFRLRSYNVFTLIHPHWETIAHL